MSIDDRDFRIAIADEMPGSGEAKGSSTLNRRRRAAARSTGYRLHPSISTHDNQDLAVLR